MYRRRVVLGGLVFLAANFFSSSHASLSTQDCLDCHQDKDIVSSSVVDPAVLGRSVHAGFDCVDCHADVTDAPHEVPPRRVACATCHEETADDYAGSFHGRAIKNEIHPVPHCSSCHGTHEIQGPDNLGSHVHKTNVVKTCEACHGDPDFIETHGLNIAAPFLARYATFVHTDLPEGPISRVTAVHEDEISHPPSEESCLLCHGNPSMEHYVDPRVYEKSIHGKHRCTSCHKDAQGTPHPEKLEPVSCGSCHRIETQIYLESDHGKAVASGISQAASCQSCHGAPHALLNSRDPDSPVNHHNIPETCARCHDDVERMSKFRLREQRPYVSYEFSVHGKAHERGLESAAVCTDCHGSHDLHGNLNPDSKVYKLNIPKTCGRCHENVLKTYQISIHGKAIEDEIIDAPVCTDCHGEHLVQGPRDEDSPVSAKNIVGTCSHCHASARITSRYGLPADRVESYMSSYHGLARQAGSLVAANCASCHGFHDVLPSSDPLSSVHPGNLANTCGKCHPGAGPQMAKAKVHLTPESGGKWIVDFVRKFYIWLIIIVIGGMIIHNALDFLRKLLNEEKASVHTDEERMTQSERIQHFILIFAFVGLAYTGLCHRYPQAVWAKPFMMIEGGADIRRFLHRALALVFVWLSFYHAVWLFFNKRGKSQLKAMLPSRNDLTEAGALMAYNTGISNKKQPFSGRFSYIEKAEYWALIWGSIVMTVTGFLLTFENLTLRFFPKWVSDLALTVHFFEGLLAVLAIIVWHLYWTVFDPDVYPMNWSWITGYVKRTARKDNGNDSKS